MKAKVPADLWKEFWYCGTPAVEAVKVAEKSSGMSGMSGGSKEPKQESKKTFTNSIGMEFVLIPVGKCPEDDPLTKVNEFEECQSKNLSNDKPFYLGKYEVTQAQWIKVMKNNPAHFKKEEVGGDPSNHPVENVSWNDVQNFIKRLNTLEKCNDCYRLPTEAEWEYAARAGSTGDYSLDKDNKEVTASNLKDYAWFDESSGNKTHPVGQKKPNGFGLHDMHGNVWEWTCSDYGNYSENNHLKCSSKNDANKSLRGGSWYVNACNCRLAGRCNVTPDYRVSGNGFRVVSVFFL